MSDVPGGAPVYLLPPVQLPIIKENVVPLNGAVPRIETVQHVVIQVPMDDMLGGARSILDINTVHFRVLVQIMAEFVRTVRANRKLFGDQGKKNVVFALERLRMSPGYMHTVKSGSVQHSATQADSGDDDVDTRIVQPELDPTTGSPLLREIVNRFRMAIPPWERIAEHVLMGMHGAQDGEGEEVRQGGSALDDEELTLNQPENIRRLVEDYFAPYADAPVLNDELYAAVMKYLLMDVVWVRHKCRFEFRNSLQIGYRFHLIIGADETFPQKMRKVPKPSSATAAASGAAAAPAPANATRAAAGSDDGEDLGDDDSRDGYDAASQDMSQQSSLMSFDGIGRDGRPSAIPASPDPVEEPSNGGTPYAANMTSPLDDSDAGGDAHNESPVAPDLNDGLDALYRATCGMNLTGDGGRSSASSSLPDNPPLTDPTVTTGAGGASTVGTDARRLRERPPAAAAEPPLGDMEPVDVPLDGGAAGAASDPQYVEVKEYVSNTPFGRFLEQLLKGNAKEGRTKRKKGKRGRGGGRGGGDAGASFNYDDIGIDGDGDGGGDADDVGAIDDDSDSDGGGGNRAGGAGGGARGDPEMSHKRAMLESMRTAELFEPHETFKLPQNHSELIEYIRYYVGVGHGPEVLRQYRRINRDQMDGILERTIVLDYSDNEEAEKVLRHGLTTRPGLVDRVDPVQLNPTFYIALGGRAPQFPYPGDVILLPLTTASTVSLLHTRIPPEFPVDVSAQYKLKHTAIRAAHNPGLPQRSNNGALQSEARREAELAVAGRDAGTLRESLEAARRVCDESCAGTTGRSHIHALVTGDRLRQLFEGAGDVDEIQAGDAGAADPLLSVSIQALLGATGVDPQVIDRMRDNRRGVRDRRIARQHGEAAVLGDDTVMEHVGVAADEAMPRVDDDASSEAGPIPGPRSALAAMEVYVKQMRVIVRMAMKRRIGYLTYVNVTAERGFLHISPSTGQAELRHTGLHSIDFGGMDARSVARHFAPTGTASLLSTLRDHPLFEVIVEVRSVMRAFNALVATYGHDAKCVILLLQMRWYLQRYSLALTFNRLIDMIGSNSMQWSPAYEAIMKYIRDWIEPETASPFTDDASQVLRATVCADADRERAAQQRRETRRRHSNVSAASARSRTDTSSGSRTSSRGNTTGGSASVGGTTARSASGAGDGRRNLRGRVSFPVRCAETDVGSTFNALQMWLIRMFDVAAETYTSHTLMLLAQISGLSCLSSEPRGVNLVVHGSAGAGKSHVWNVISKKCRIHGTTEFEAFASDKSMTDQRSADGKMIVQDELSDGLVRSNYHGGGRDNMEKVNRLKEGLTSGVINVKRLIKNEKEELVTIEFTRQFKVSFAGSTNSDLKQMEEALRSRFVCYKQWPDQRPGVPLSCGMVTQAVRDPRDQAISDLFFARCKMDQALIFLIQMLICVGVFPGGVGEHAALVLYATADNALHTHYGLNRPHKDEARGGPRYRQITHNMARVMALLGAVNDVFHARETSSLARQQAAMDADALDTNRHVPFNPLQLLMCEPRLWITDEMAVASSVLRDGGNVSTLDHQALTWLAQRCFGVPIDPETGDGAYAYPFECDEPDARAPPRADPPLAAVGGTSTARSTGPMPPLPGRAAGAAAATAAQNHEARPYNPSTLASAAVAPAAPTTRTALAARSTGRSGAAASAPIIPGSAAWRESVAATVDDVASHVHVLHQEYYDRKVDSYHQTRSGDVEQAWSATEVLEIGQRRDPHYIKMKDATLDLVMDMVRSWAESHGIKQEQMRMLLYEASQTTMPVRRRDESGRPVPDSAPVPVPLLVFNPPLRTKRIPGGGLEVVQGMETHGRGMHGDSSSRYAAGWNVPLTHDERPRQSPTKPFVLLLTEYFHRGRRRPEWLLRNTAGYLTPETHTLLHVCASVRQAREERKYVLPLPTKVISGRGAYDSVTHNFHNFPALVVLKQANEHAHLADADANDDDDNERSTAHGFDADGVVDGRIAVKMYRPYTESDEPIARHVETPINEYGLREYMASALGGNASVVNTLLGMPSNIRGEAAMATDAPTIDTLIPPETFMPEAVLDRERARERVTGATRGGPPPAMKRYPDDLIRPYMRRLNMAGRVAGDSVRP